MVDDLVFRNSAHKPVCNLAVFERKHCGDTHYLISGSQGGALIHVDFYEFYKPGVLRSEFIKKGQQSLAVAAPRRPEKRHHGSGEPEDFGVKCAFVHNQCAFGVCGGEVEGSAALAANRFFSNPRTGNAIFCAAMSASYYKIVLKH